MLFRRCGRAQPARSARRADGGADRRGGSRRPGIGRRPRRCSRRASTRRARACTRRSARRAARASGARSRRPARTCSSARRSRAASAVLLHARSPARGSGSRSRAAASSGTTCTASPRASLSASRRASKPTRSSSRASGSSWSAGSRASRCCCVATLALLLRWVSQPVRRLEHEIKEVEAGTREQLGERWPRELSGGHQQSQCAARWRAQAHQALSRHARQSRAQPEDAARGDAPVAAAAPMAPANGDARCGNRPHDRHHRAPAEARRGQRRRVARPGAGGRGAVVAELRVALLKVYGNKDLLFETAIAPERAVHRRSRRPHRAARQPARQRLQVGALARAHRWRRSMRLRIRAPRCAS